MNWPWPTRDAPARRYRAPGVSEDESRIQIRSIAGVDTRVAGFLGVTERGPAAPRLVTSADEFTAHYGEVIDHGHLADAVAGFFENGGKRCYVGRITATDETAEAVLTDADGGATIRVAALGPGAWGSNVAITVANSASGQADEFALRVRYWRKVPDGVDTSSPDVESVLGDPAVEETYEALSMAAHAPTLFETAIDGTSRLVETERVGGNASNRPANGTTFLDGPTGAESEPTRADYRGTVSGRVPTGLAAFAEIDDISIVCVPAAAQVAGLAQTVEGHCAALGDRFAVLDAPRDVASVQSLFPPVDSRYAAVYYPWLVVDAATPGAASRVVPPCGHVAGIYARVDTNRGVHHVPANEVVYGALDVQRDVTAAEQGVLNPRGVNCIRTFAGRGIRVWGGRTTASDPEWRYVNVSRLLVHLEESIREGIQWVRFEPNTEAVWHSIERAVRSFLFGAWRTGALRGATQSEAFFVRCDRSTMSQQDIERGHLVVHVGVAPVRPAEFVLVEIAAQTADASPG